LVTSADINQVEETKVDEKPPIVLCIDCKSLQQVRNDRCSQCAQKYDIVSTGIPKTAEGIWYLPACIYKGELIEGRLLEIFDYWAKFNSISYSFVKSDNEYHDLLESCKNKTSAQIYTIIRKNNPNNKPLVLISKYADMLLKDLKVDIMHDDDWKYIHAICPNVLDVWHMRNNMSVFLCYYQSFGELKKCPYRTEELISLWTRPFSIEGHVKREGACNFGNCTKCSKIVRMIDNYLVCIKCNNYSHKDCIPNIKSCIKCDFCIEKSSDITLST